MFFPGGRKDNNIVEGKQACFPVEAGEDAIHQAREGDGSVTKTEWDLIEFVQLPTAGTKGGLCFVALLNWDLPIATLQIQGRKPLGAMERVEEVIYPGQWVCVLDGSCVYLSKIDAKTQATVLFFHYYCWRSPRTVGGVDDVAGQHLLDLRHLLPPHSRVLSPVGLTEWRSMGLYSVLQQRSTAEIVFPLTEDVVELSKQIVQLLLLER